MATSIITELMLSANTLTFDTIKDFFLRMALRDDVTGNSTRYPGGQYDGW